MQATIQTTGQRCTLGLLDRPTLATGRKQLEQSTFGADWQRVNKFHLILDGQWCSTPPFLEYVIFLNERAIGHA